jgi:uncharacterized MAPEG superfamily protein
LQIASQKSLALHALFNLQTWDSMMTFDLWILVGLAVLTELLTLPPLYARTSVPGGWKWIFFNRDTELQGVAPWGHRAVRAHANLVANLGIYAAVILVAHVTGATNEVTHTAGLVLLVSRLVYTAVYIAGIPYLRTAVFAVGQMAMLVYVWQTIARTMSGL